MNSRQFTFRLAAETAPVSCFRGFFDMPPEDAAADCLNYFACGLSLPRSRTSLILISK
jgi:hypothetical protein